MLHLENVNLTPEDLNSSFDELENQWNIHTVSYDNLTSQAIASSIERLTLILCIEFWDSG